MLQQETIPPIRCEILRPCTDSEVKLDYLLVARNRPGNQNRVKTLTVNHYTCTTVETHPLLGE